MVTRAVSSGESVRARTIVVAFLETLNVVVLVYVFLVLTSALLSWLAAFKVIDDERSFAATLGDVVYVLTEFFLEPVRRMLPSTSGMDISPVILGTFLLVVSRCLREMIANMSAIS